MVREVSEDKDIDQLEREWQRRENDRPANSASTEPDAQGREEALREVYDPQDTLKKVDEAIAADSVRAAYDLVHLLAHLDSKHLGIAKSNLKNHFGSRITWREFNDSIKECQEKLKSTSTAQSADETEWRHLLILNTEGGVRPNLANAVIALRHDPDWNGVLAFDEFAVRPIKRNMPPFPNGSVGWWTEDDDIATADWLQHRDINVSTAVAAEAIQLVSKDAAFHPVRDWLDSLKWDGKKRIRKFLSRYFGAEDTAYARAIGACWLRSAVARIFEPGCKVDHTLILEGDQGIHKSSALRELAGPEFFTDDVEDLGSKDSAMQVHGVWIVELAELDAMRRSDVSRIKAFLARQKDRFRPPYGRRVAEFPRQSVFAGSTNQSTYLNDETGARRFWPIKVKRIKLDNIKADRDQIWAEAVAEYKSGKKWWLDTAKLNLLARQEQVDRFEEDAWQAGILEWAEERISLGAPSVSVSEVLEGHLQKSRKDWTKQDEMRVARCLRAGGFIKRQRDKRWTKQVPPCATSR